VRVVVYDWCREIGPERLSQHGLVHNTETELSNEQIMALAEHFDISLRHRRVDETKKERQARKERNLPEPKLPLTLGLDMPGRGFRSR